MAVTPPATGITGAAADFDLLRAHHADPARFPFLLESVAHGTAQSRHDILFTDPGESLVLDADGRVRGPFAERGSFLAALDAWFEAERAPRPGGAPFGDGWFLYLGYELAGEIEPRLVQPRHRGDFPVAFATRCRGAWVRDHARGTLVPAGAAETGAPVFEAPPLAQVTMPAWERITEDPPGHYRKAVRRILEYIRAGDVFQVNIARAWRALAEDSADPTALYRLLRRTNPAPFAGIARFGDGAVVSSSPERLVAVRGNRVETRPIAGTRPRGARGRDRALSEELMRHPKERAEHIMLIDLERNDLGRVCVPGSVHVNELMVLESYAHVHHIVSNVGGTLRNGVTPAQVVRAVFPGGTITGCPKVRCMEIIAELEGEGRGPYTGAMGYLNADGDMDLNILIRSLLAQDGQVTLRAGAGIVADSDPARELSETRHKAKGLLLALGGTVS